MLAFKSILLFLFAMVATAIVIPRDGASVQSSLQDLDVGLQKLTHAVSKFGGGLPGEIAIQQSKNKLRNRLVKATTAVQTSTPLSAGESRAAIDLVNGSLEPHLEEMISALIEKKKKVHGAHLLSKVREALDGLRGRAQAVGGAFVGIASADTKADAQAAVGKIDGAFARGVAAYA